MNPLFVSLAILLLAGLCAAQPAGRPLEMIERLNAPYFDTHDPLALPLKVKAIASSPYKFWRGTKDLFYFWTKDQCTDWLADPARFVPIHGDLHFGNIGTYAVQPWGTTAFGEVDFDEACTAPFQLELLSGVITLKLVAQQNAIKLDTELRRQLTVDLLKAYVKAIVEPSQLPSASSLPAALRRVFELREVDYGDELSACTVDHHFRTKLESSKGVLKEILRPAAQRGDEFADGLAAAVKNDPAAAKLFRYQTREEFRGAILDIAQRTRLGSAGSQGLRKYLILLHRPLTTTESDVIVYFKQAIPTAAERSGAIPRSALSPGRRLKESMDALTEPPPLLNSWCDVGGESYWVGLKEPWSREIDSAYIRTADDLHGAAQAWGQVAGAAHRRWAATGNIAPQISDQLQHLLDERSDTFVNQLDADYAAFVADPAVKRAILEADDELLRATRAN